MLYFENVKQTSVSAEDYLNIFDNKMFTYYTVARMYFNQKGLYPTK